MTPPDESGCAACATCGRPVEFDRMLIDLVVEALVDLEAAATKAYMANSTGAEQLALMDLIMPASAARDAIRRIRA